MTTIEETITKLSELKLMSMITAVRELQQTAPGHELSFDEKLGIVVDREWTDRENRRLARRIKDAKLSTRASLDNVKSWHEALNDPTIADAICDRLVHNAHVLKLGGPSIRRKKALQPETSTSP